MPVIRAVLFDLDNTLVDRDGAFREYVHSRFNDPEDRAELLALDNGGYGDREELFRCWKQRCGESMSQTQLGAAIANRLQPDEELLNTLGCWAHKVKLGIITNGTGGMQRSKIIAARLDKVFAPDCIWISAELGAAKPQPAIFQTASNAIEVLPEQCLFIGDREREDRDGALAAGMHARLVKSVLNAPELIELLREVETA